MSEFQQGGPIPEVDPNQFATYHRKSGPWRGSDPPDMRKRSTALAEIADARLWKTDGGGYTDAVVAAAAVAKCDWKSGFDVEDLLAKAMALPRPALKLLNEPGFTEPMLLCNKCGAWWGQSQSEAHQPGC
jgi:hypothetical protein